MQTTIKDLITFIDEKEEFTQHEHQKQMFRDVSKKLEHSYMHERCLTRTLRKDHPLRECGVLGIARCKKCHNETYFTGRDLFEVKSRDSVYIYCHHCGKALWFPNPLGGDSQPVFE